jgi:hypothetical protein
LATATSSDNCIATTRSGHSGLSANCQNSPASAWARIRSENIFTPIGLKNLSFIANSDFHKPKHIYSWKTLLHCPKEPEAIKDCIRGNHDVAITLYRDLGVAPAAGRGFVATPPAGPLAQASPHFVEIVNS